MPYKLFWISILPTFLGYSELYIHATSLDEGISCGRVTFWAQLMGPTLLLMGFVLWIKSGQQKKVEQIIWLDNFTKMGIPIIWGQIIFFFYIITEYNIGIIILLVFIILSVKLLNKIKWEIHVFEIIILLGLIALVTNDYHISFLFIITFLGWVEIVQMIKKNYTLLNTIRKILAQFIILIISVPPLINYTNIYKYHITLFFFIGYIKIWHAKESEQIWLYKINYILEKIIVFIGIFLVYFYLSDPI